MSIRTFLLDLCGIENALYAESKYDDLVQKLGKTNKEYKFNITVPSGYSDCTMPYYKHGKRKKPKQVQRYGHKQLNDQRLDRLPDDVPDEYFEELYNRKGGYDD